jgi:DNA-binding XRE family transcriptional regulator
MDNPIKVYREANGWTLETLATKVGCSKQLVIRTEQGCYPKIPPAIVDFFAYNPTVKVRPDTTLIQVEYREYQTEVRISNYGTLYAGFNFSRVADSVHPFTAWRESSDLNLTQVCKMFCLHPATIFKFEKQPYLVNSLPQPLVEALNESGYNEQVCFDLSAAYQRYLAQLSANIKVKVGNESEKSVK